MVLSDAVLRPLRAVSNAAHGDFSLASPLGGVLMSRRASRHEAHADARDFQRTRRVASILALHFTIATFTEDARCSMPAA